jgi:uncharacterized protein YndB with AHSA1/START domain
MSQSTVPLCTFVDSSTIRFDRTYPVPIETAWDYLTRRDLLELWLADAVIEPRVGGRVDLQFAEDPCRDEKACHSMGTVLEWNPPTRLSYTWQEEHANGPEDATFVIFELAPVEGGTQLNLTHKRLVADKRYLYGAGWHAHLEVMAARIAGSAPGVFSILFNEILAVYAELAQHHD